MATSLISLSFLSALSLKRTLILICAGIFSSGAAIGQQEVSDHTEVQIDSLHYFIKGEDSLCVSAPKMTTSQRDSITHPKRDMIIYNMDEKKCNIYTNDDNWKPYQPFYCGERYFDRINVRNYSTVFFHDKCWMLENLTAEKFSSGDYIGEVREKEDWESLQTAGWCNYKNDPKAEANIGKLYNWYAVNDEQGLCPKGWRVPGFYEWKDLIESVCDKGKKYEILDPGSEQLMNSLKAKSCSTRQANGNFLFENSIHKGNYWTSDEFFPGYAYSVDPQYKYKRKIKKCTEDERIGLLVRCIAIDNSFYQRFCTLSDTSGKKDQLPRKKSDFIHFGFGLGTTCVFLLIHPKDDLSTRIYSGEYELRDIEPGADYILLPIPQTRGCLFLI